MSGFVIAKNAAYNLVAFAVTLLVTFLLVPVMLLHLGPVGFGVWAIARVFVSYASLSDFGLSSTVTKFVAEFQSRQDWKRLAAVLQAAFVLYTVIAAVVLMLVWIFIDVLVVTFFGDSGQFAVDVRFVLLGSMAIFAVNLVGTVFSSAINGLQRMDITNALTACYWLINGVAMYAALVLGYGLRGIIYANALATALLLLANALFFFRVFSHVPILSVRLRFHDLWVSLRYSKDIFVVAVANSVHLHYDKLLLSSMVSLGAVSSYEVASRVIQVMRQIIVLLLNPILPVASSLQAQQRVERVLALYYHAIKFLIFFCIPLFVCVGVCANALMALWLGKHNVLIELTLQALLFANFANLLTGPAYFISLGIGKAKYAMYSSVLGLTLNVVLSFVFLRWLGYIGLLAGTSLALGCEALLFLLLFHRTLGVQRYIILRLLAQPLIGIIVAAAVGIGLGALVGTPVLKAILTISATAGIYLLLMINRRYFDEDDRVFLREVKEKILSRLMVTSQ